MKRSNLAVGMDWASRAATVGLEFALPPLIGAGLDRRFGSSPVGTLIGVFLGFGVGMLHVLRIARAGAETGTKSDGDGPGPQV